MCNGSISCQHARWQCSLWPFVFRDEPVQMFCTTSACECGRRRSGSLEAPAQGVSLYWVRSTTLVFRYNALWSQCRNPIHKAHYELFIRALDAPNVGEGAVVLVHPTCGPTQVCSCSRFDARPRCRGSGPSSRAEAQTVAETRMGKDLPTWLGHRRPWLQSISLGLCAAPATTTVL